MPRSNLEYVILAGSSTSPYKSTWANSASLVRRAYSLPRGHRVQPSASCSWGPPGSTSGRGCVQVALSQIVQPHDLRLRALVARGCSRSRNWSENQLKRRTGPNIFRLRRAKPAALCAALFTKKDTRSLHLMGARPADPIHTVSGAPRPFVVLLPVSYGCH